MENEVYKAPVLEIIEIESEGLLADSNNVFPGGDDILNPGVKDTSEPEYRTDFTKLYYEE